MDYMAEICIDMNQAIKNGVILALLERLILIII